MVGPDYKEPVKPVLTHWKNDGQGIKEQPFNNQKWWRVFHDPVLTKLINEGYQRNLNLQSTAVRVLQYRALLAQSVGSLYPQQQGMTGNYTYNRIGGGQLDSILPPSFTTALMGFKANWEIDFWGKYRRAILANNAAFLASIVSYDNALVTLTADIATAYIKMRTTESEIKITKENIKVQATGLKIARSRYNAGQASLLDVQQAKTELSETESKLPTLRAVLKKEKNALSFLLGGLPNQLDKTLAKSKGIPRAPREVAVGIPRDTLRRRPDIYQARLEAVSQLEKIGQTKASLYPAFSLSGTFAFASNDIFNSSVSDLFSWSNRTITAGPSFTWPLLNYGQITNAVRAQDAIFQQSMLRYINLVLKAQEEVQNNINDYLEAKKARTYLKRANISAIKAFKLALIRYKEGETSFTPVLNAEQQQLRVQTSLVNAEGSIPQSLVALYRALGGGWEIRQGRDMVPLSIKKEMAKRTNWGNLLVQKNHDLPVTKWQSIEERYLPVW